MEIRGLLMGRLRLGRRMVPLGLLCITALLLLLPPSAIVQGRHHELNNGAAIGSHQLSGAGAGLSSQSAQSGSLASGVISSAPAAGVSSSSSLASSGEEDVARITLSKDAGRLDRVRNSGSTHTRTPHIQRHACHYPFFSRANATSE